MLGIGYFLKIAKINSCCGFMSSRRWDNTHPPPRTLLIVAPTSRIWKHPHCATCQQICHYYHVTKTDKSWQRFPSSPLQKLSFNLLTHEKEIKSWYFPNVYALFNVQWNARYCEAAWLITSKSTIVRHSTLSKKVLFPNGVCHDRIWSIILPDVEPLQTKFSRHVYRIQLEQRIIIIIY